MYQSNETADGHHAPPSVVLLYTILHKMVLTFESLDEILKCDQSNESY